MESSEHHHPRVPLVPPGHQGVYFDRLNSLLYYLHAGTLHRLPLIGDNPSPTIIPISPLGVTHAQAEPLIPRFVPSDTSSDLLVSPNGFYLINGSDKEEVVMTNLAFSKGVHFWEFYCPLSLYGIGLGVGRKNGKKNQTHLFTFTASTPRLISMKLDVEGRKLYAWVNKQKQHVLELDNEECWYPCVSIKSKGNVVVFNPYSTDPQERISIYNPFNTVEVPQAVSLATTKPKESFPDPNLRLLSINDNQLALYTSDTLRVVTRNKHTNQFEFNWFEAPEKESSSVGITFSHKDLSTLNEYLKKHSLAELPVQSVSSGGVLIQASLRGWFEYLRSLTTQLQNNKSEPEIFEIVLSKVEHLRPYLHILNETLQPLLYSKYNRLSAWKSKQECSFFSFPEYEFKLPLSDFVNYVPLTCLQPFRNISSSKNHLIVTSPSKLSIYNIELTPFKVFESDLSSLSSKNFDLRNNLVYNSIAQTEGPQIYKILYKCLNTTTENTAPKKVEVNPRMLATLTNVFKYSQEEATKALIDTKNSSLDDAVALVELAKTHKDQQLIYKQHDTQLQESPLASDEILSVSVVDTEHSLSPLLLSVRTEKELRVYLVGVNIQYLQKFYFKEDKGFVSFINFQYLDNLEQFDREDISYRNYHFGSGSENFYSLQMVEALPVTGIIDQRLVIKGSGFELLTLTADNKIKHYLVNLSVRNSSLDLTPFEETTCFLDRIPVYNGRLVEDKNNTPYVAACGSIIVSSQTFHQPQKRLFLKIAVENVTQTIDCPTTPDEKPSEEQFIPLLVEQGPPGCNMNYPICSILYPTNNEFLANYPYTLVLKQLHDKYMKVSTVVISRIGKRRNVKEVKEGLVWLSNHKNLRSDSSRAYRFSFGVDQNRITMKINETEFMKYLFIMPIYEKETTKNLPFEIGFVGVTGESREESSFQESVSRSILSGEMAGAIEITQDGQSILATPNDFSLLEDKYVKISIDLPFNGEVSVNVKHPWTLLKRREVVRERKTEEQSISLTELTDELCAGKSLKENKILRCILESDLKLMSDERTQKLLNKVMESSSIKYEDKRALVLQLLQGSHSNVVKEYFYHSLKLAHEMPIPNLDILDIAISNNLYDEAALPTLVDSVLDKVKSLHNNKYKDLRSQGINHLLLERTFYSDYYFNEVELKSEKEAIAPLYQSNLLVTDFAVVKERFVRSMFIDLKKQANIQFLLLCFEKSELKTKMRLNVYKDNKELVYSHFYHDYTWIQLTKNPYTKEMKQLFSKPINAGLNCLGIQLGITARYLKVEISHTVLPTLGEAVEMENLPFIEIIPEVFGTLEEEGGEIEEISKFFRFVPESAHFVSTININNLSEFSKRSVSNSNYDYHVYTNVKSVASKGSAEETRARYDTKLEDKDYAHAIPLLKEVLKDASHTPGLDYYYTLLMKLLELPLSLTKETQAKIYHQLVLNQKGPIHTKALKLLLSQPQYYEKSLLQVDRDSVKLFSQQKLKQDLLRTHIKSTFSNENSNARSVELLMEMLMSHPDVKIEEWLQEMIMLSAKSNNHHEILKLLKNVHWSNKPYVKAYLISLCRSDETIYRQLLSSYTSNTLLEFVVELLQSNEEYTALVTLEIALANLSKLQENSSVQELIKVILPLLETSSNSQELWAAVDKLVLSTKTDQNIKAVEALLQSHPYIQLSHSEMTSKVLKEEPQKITHLLLNSILDSHHRPSATNVAYLTMLINNNSQLSHKDLQKVIELSGEYFLTECSFGGIEGVKCITQPQFDKYKWGSMLIKLISPNIGHINDSIRNIDQLNAVITWLLLNNTHELNIINPAFRTLTYDVITNVEHSFTLVLENAISLRGAIIKKIIEMCGKLTNQLKQHNHLLMSTKHIIAHRLHQGSISLIERLLNHDPKLYSEVIGSAEVLNEMIKTLRTESIPKGKAVSTLAPEIELTDTLKFDKKEGEIKVDVKDWGINKIGNSKSSLFNISTSSGVITLVSPTQIHAHKFLLGFLAVENTDKSNIYPKSIDCFIGDSPQKLTFVGKLRFVDDQCFSNHNIRVFGLNLNRLKCEDGVRNCIRSITNKGFKCVRFQIEKPSLVSLSDILETQQKSPTFQNYSISFLSISGYEEPKHNPSFIDLYLKLLSLLSYPQFEQSLKELLNKDVFKKQFSEFLAVLGKWMNVPEYKDIAGKLVVSMSEQSEELGNIILDTLLRQSSKGQTNSLIGQMIIKAPTLASSRILKFHSSIMELINRDSVSYDQLHQPIQSYLNALQLTNFNMEKYNQPPITLPIEEQDVQSILRLYSDFNREQKPLIIEFLNILAVTHGRINVNSELPLSLLKRVWFLKHKQDFYPLIAPFSTINKDVVGWFLETESLKEIVADVISAIDQEKEVTNSILLLATLSNNQKINDEINRNSWQITIFKTLADTSNSAHILKDVERESLKHFVELFQNTCIDTSNEIHFTLMLKELLTDLPSKYSLEFLYDFFMPLINSYKSIPIVLQPYGRESKVYLQKANQILENKPLRVNKLKEEVRGKFFSHEAKRIITSTGDYWMVAEANDFPSKANIVLLESTEPEKTILLIANNDVITIIDGQHHEALKLTDPIKLSSNIELKLIKKPNGEIRFQHSGFASKLTIEAYNSFLNSNSLIVNDLLLSVQKSYSIDTKFLASSSLRYTTRQPLYKIPAEFKVSDLVSEINLSGLAIPQDKIQSFNIRKILSTESLPIEKSLNDLKDSNIVLRLEYDVEELLEETSLESIVNQTKTQKLRTITNVGLFRSFRKQGGVAKTIEIVIESISSWKNKQQAKKWLQYAQELKSFSFFPAFFELYMQDKQNVELLFNLLASLPDIQDPKRWEEKEKEAVKSLYKILGEVMKVDNTIQTKEYVIENKFFQTILERLQMVSKQQKRTLGEEEEKEPEARQTLQPIEPKKEDISSKKNKKKKGVGYGNDSSSNQKWDISQQEAQRKEISDQVLNIIEILISFFETKGWVPPTSVAESIYTSALLPIIESALRGGSLLEISKISSVFQGYLKFIRVISEIPSMIPVLMDIPRNYVPRQSESIYSLLKQLESTNRIFLSALTTNNSNDNKANLEITKDIIETAERVRKAVESFDDYSQKENQRILELPLDQKYKLLLKDLRFDYISMKDNSGKFKHHYSSSYSTNYTPPLTKTVRLAQELADVSTALPIEHTNSIFIRCDKERIDFMQALIMGPNDTPYGHGAFLFDIHFEDTYPSVPPKVNLTTTGNALVRFNPNLYSCGKVCLSLLGTWRGNATENWDPKVSTLLQVLISIQSIIMTDDVYFNEPGFQLQQDTVEGEKKNEAYSNIVRLCNIKYAMIDSIKKPPKGFESVIRRHFYLKKNDILKECKKWVEMAGVREASYTGLISDHNSNWCNDFKKSKTKYKELMIEAVKELEIQLNKIPPPSASDLLKTEEKVEGGESKKESPAKQITEEANLEDIDVTYNKTIVSKELNVNDEQVTNRWSRYIGAMGIDAVSRQSKANILVFGLNPTALEIVKNLVLSGCKKLSIVDDKTVEWTDLSGQFFLSEEDIGKNRVDSCLHKIQELNYYVKVEKLELELETQLAKLQDYQLVIASSLPLQQQIRINNFCHNLSIPFIAIDVYGPHARLFNDFGESFEVLDKNGEDPVQVIIESITTEENGILTVMKGTRQPYEDGDVVTILRVEGMEPAEGKESINGSTHKVKVLNARQFSIGDTRGYTQYIRNGVAKNVKLPVTISFGSLEQALKMDQIPIDQSLMYYDFAKINNTRILHYALIAQSKFYSANQRLPHPWNYEDSQSLVELYKHEDKEEFTLEKEGVVRKLSFTSRGTFPPLCAFMGGYVAQEAIKAITKKYMPTHSLFYCDFNNIVDDLPSELFQWEEAVSSKKYTPRQERSEGLRIVVGDDLLKEIEKCKVFMIGSGAIGCELLKNYAMIELGTGKGQGEGKGGHITLTDPDHIEVSNLNRQFLFREKHLRKPKSSTAAASAIQMNHRLKDHITARLDRISDATKDIFSDEFFQSMTIITNALDNVQARRYVDQRCIENRVPLLESGTLGPKGHVQVIVPGLTETYGSKQDPAEDGEIPHCTLKMFPEETLHCIEWARDKFGQKFSLKPKALQKVIETKDYKPDPSEIKSLRQSLKLITKKPDTFGDCIHYAVNKFYKYYRNDIKQLLYTYPLDSKTKDGQPFWKLPKRPPTPIETFDAKNILHCIFVTSLAVMTAKIYDIPYPEDFRKDARRYAIGQEAEKFVIKEFVPSDKKAQEISEEVAKQFNKEEEETEKEEKEHMTEIQLVQKIHAGLVNKELRITPEEFDKDEDERGHIDLIYSMANLRSINYCLEPMDWITTKLKAGKIVPALVTTTTSIAALQTYELVKYLKKLKIADMRNSFLNLAVPLIQLSEPGEIQKIKIHDKLTTNVWDRWEMVVNPSTTLAQVLDKLDLTYGLKSKDVIMGSTPVYMSAMMDLESKKTEREQLLSTPVKDVLGISEGYVDVTVTFTLLEGGDLLKQVPKVRITFQ